MKRILIPAVLLLMCCTFANSLTATKTEDQGKAWLDAQKNPSSINVNGTWDSEEWGVFHLSQAEGSRDVGGSGGGYVIKGVVSGKSLFMLFYTDRTVEYCATLSLDGNNAFTGSYSNRVSRFSKGLCQDKSRPMYMTKR